MDGAAIKRHKTTIRRGDFSRSVKCLLRDIRLGKGQARLDGESRWREDEQATTRLAGQLGASRFTPG